MNITGRQIGSDQPVYIIAEIGVNHDGNVDRALELVQQCAAADVDAVKLQLFTADLLLSKKAVLAEYQKRSGAGDPFRMLRQLELGIEEMGRVVDAAHRHGLHAVVSIFSVELVQQAAELAWDAFKIASPDIVHHPLLREIAARERPMIVSTGAANAAEVTAAARLLAGVRDLSFLHCISAYPVPLREANLAAIPALAGLVAEAARRPLPVGYSDHTSEIHTGALAVACGAVMLEKHVTWSRAASGPDHAASLEPADLARYVQSAREAGEALGPRRKHVTDIEREVRDKSRQSVIASTDLPAGHVLRKEDLTFKRPGSGIYPCDLENITGRRLLVPVPADTPLTREMLAPAAVTAPG
ncbi:MAG TPA: hypothetical protein ENJ06_03205 [Phycisphaeraceae bacterium]|nr:hypothetical protein [Phycisphaeraceae bacterium]